MSLVTMRGRRSGGSMAARIGVVFLMATTCLIITEGAAREKIYYADFERPVVIYINPKYVRNFNVTALRHGRKDPIHYITAHGETLSPAGNNVSEDAYVYEFLSNEYRRSFVELHFKWCDLLLHSPLYSRFFDQLPKVCPLPMGKYHVANLSMFNFPLLRHFPFQKGRYFLNVTLIGKGKERERIGDGYIDFLIKEKWQYDGEEVNPRILHFWAD